MKLTAPQVGHPVPQFRAQDSTSEYFSSETLHGRPFVLYFYPKNGTPGCTAQACDIRDAKIPFERLNVVVLGVSPDQADSHNTFIADNHLNFHLIPDSELELCKTFDVWKTKNVDGKEVWGVERTTFVIDAKGIIRWIERPVKVEGHTQRVLQVLKEFSKTASSV